MKAVFDQAQAGSAAGISQPLARVGILQPGTEAPRDLLQWTQALGPAIATEVEHVALPGYIHGIHGLRALGDLELLAPAARALAQRRVQALVWACTSGSVVLGSRGARCQMRTISGQAGVPATSTALALAVAVRALHLRRVAVAASYPSAVIATLESFLRDEEVDAVRLVSFEARRAPAADHLHELAVADHPRAEALLIPDDTLATAGQVPTLEAAIGKVVLTAGQVAAWAGALLAGLQPVGPGRLFGAETGAACSALLA